MKIGDIVVRKSYDKDIIFRIIDIKEVRGKVYCILKGLSIRIIADSPKDDLEVVDYVYVEEKEKILNIFITNNTILIINNILIKTALKANIFIKHLVHLKNTLYLCAH